MKNGIFALILLVTRVSRPDDPAKVEHKKSKQDIRSLDDQEKYLQEWIDTHVDCPYEVKVIRGSGSGEHLDRAEVHRLEELVATGVYDLVLTEDLGRIMRRIRCHSFCEECLDTDTRVIAISATTK